MLRVREGAGTKYKQVGSLERGTQVVVYEEKSVNGILWGRTDLGWVSLDYIQICPSAQDMEKAVTGVVIAPNGMNVRSKPGAWNNLVGRLGTGIEVQIYETTLVNGVSWGRIDNGWVCMSYIQLVPELDEDDKTENPETPGEGGTTTDPETPGEGGTTTDPETPGEGGTTTDPEEPEIEVISSTFAFTAAEYASRINEQIASTGYLLAPMEVKPDLSTYGLCKTGEETPVLAILFETDATSGKVAGISLVGPVEESEATKGLLRAITEAAIKVVDAENVNGMIDELFKTEPEVDTEGNTMYGIFDDKLMLAYTETQESEETPAMAMYMIYAIEIVEAE